MAPRAGELVHDEAKRQESTAARRKETPDIQPPYTPYVQNALDILGRYSGKLSNIRCSTSVHDGGTVDKVENCADLTVELSRTEEGGSGLPCLIRFR